jgi:heat-inducible transcriptional repressor
MELSARQKALLSIVIERYVRDAEPIGSAVLASDASFRALFGPVSSATIRAELAELEEAGLLAQPHTSAGRVPSDAGYRFYVNEMLRPRPLRSAEKTALQNIPTPPSSVEDALRDATALLAQMTGYPAVATLPSGARDTMRQVQISSVPPHRLLLVLLTQSGRVENRLFEVGAEEIGANTSRLTQVANFLNENLRGRTLSEVRALSFDDVSAGLHEAGTIALARRAWEHARASVGDLHDERLVVQGVVTLLDEPEFSEIEHARAALRLFDNASALSDLLAANMSAVQFQRENEKRGPQTIVIGREHGLVFEAGGPSVERLSFVGIAYGVGGEVLGTVGVLGPTRMKYGDALSLVPALSARLQQSLESL